MERRYGGTVCLCGKGYDGVSCDINIDECASQPCKNGGVCKDTLNGFTCHCLEIYSGELCEAGECHVIRKYVGRINASV